MSEQKHAVTSDNQRIVGAAPAGARDQEAAAAAVREMFTSIAPRYDLLNHVLVDEHGPVVVEPHGARVRGISCGVQMLRYWICAAELAT